MKKLAIIFFLIFAISFGAKAQKPYSVEILEQASQEELNVYLNKSLKLQKTGKTLTNAGAIAFGATTLWAITDPLNHGLGALLPFTLVGVPGLAAIAVGIPIKVTGKKRVERINTIKNTAYDGIKIDLKPCAQYNLATRNYQPGVILRISF